MKIINFGSLNIDKVYTVESFARPGQTIFAENYEIFPGGKGLNQSVACAKAGARVIHAGCVGKDGLFLKDLLDESGVDTSFLQILDEPSGHAVIEVDSSGQNKIIVFSGTNQMLTENYIDQTLKQSAPGDIVLLQNETNLIGEIIKKAHEIGLLVAFNPSPMPKNPEMLPLEMVSFFLVNEIEALQLSGADKNASFEEILLILSQKFPEAKIIMTLGDEGVLYKDKNETAECGIFPVPALDTTAAGDTFTGFFLSAVCENIPVKEALRKACAACAIAVSRKGAAVSIPALNEVSDFIKNFDGRTS